MVNNLGTPVYNTKLVYILIRQLKFKIVLELVKQGVSVLLNAVYMNPVTKMYQNIKIHSCVCFLVLAIMMSLWLQWLCIHVYC